MALPFWNKTNGNTDRHIHSETPKSLHELHPPNCLLVGAGGCSLAHTLAANLFLDRYNRPMDDATRQLPGLTAVEACPEILRASRLWFGAGEASSTNTRDDSFPEPPFFDLVHDTGESYLQSLVESLERQTAPTNATTTSTFKNPRPIDILIVDAEDGSAPPKSMQSPAFWKDLVLPSLNPAGGFVVGVNSIGTSLEISALVRTLREAFDRKCTVLVVDPPPNARVTDRHKLVFALPMAIHDESLARDDLSGHVDAPEAWEEQLRKALRDAIVKR